MQMQDKIGRDSPKARGQKGSSTSFAVLCRVLSFLSLPPLFASLFALLSLRSLPVPLPLSSHRVDPFPCAAVPSSLACPLFSSFLSLLVARLMKRFPHPPARPLLPLPAPPLFAGCCRATLSSFARCINQSKSVR